jgi:hypothetical protein
MKSIVFFLLILPSLIHATNYREKLDSAMSHEHYADLLIQNWSKKIDNSNMGYLAVVCMMKSNHACFPFTKLKYFNKGRKLLERAIEFNPHSIELIYFRFEIQRRLPAVLSYDNRKEDRIRMRNFLANKENKKMDVALYSKIEQILSL